MYQAVGSYFPNGDDESLLCTLDLSEGSSKHFPKERFLSVGLGSLKWNVTSQKRQVANLSN